MSDSHANYDNPLIDRYASAEMSRLWGPQRKFSTWRRLWVALAEAEAELGLPITPAQIAELRAARRLHRLCRRRRHEARLRHDVMAHVHAFGDACPGRGDHPPGGDQLLCHRQHRPDPDARGAGAGPRPAGRRDRRPGRLRPAASRPALPGASPTSSRPSRPRSANGPACGPTTWCKTWPRSSTASPRSAPAASKGRPAPRPAFWSCSTATTPRCSSSNAAWPPRSASPKSIPSPARPIPAKSTRRCSTRCRAWPKALEDGHRSAAAAKPQGDRRAVRGGADRLVGHGLQAQPDAVRADLRAGPLRAQPANRAPPPPPPRNGWSERSTTAPTAGW